MCVYRNRIRKIEDFSVKKLIENCRQHVPSQYRWRPYKHPELNHGVDLLRSDNALDCYLVAYGEMHYVKCCAALQNFPFATINGTIEIVDWGCGQGIGSLTVIEALKNRELINLLKKVTLIEPSEAALNRAKENILYATSDRVTINLIAEYLPTDNSLDNFTGVNYTCSHVIHVFSNILDVNGIDLSRLAQAVVTSAHNHFIICAGPLNSNAYRIDRFCQIFGSQEFFSNISNSRYALTSDTNHPITCKTKCFSYNGDSLNLDAYNPNENPTNEVLNEYDDKLLIQNGILSLDKARIYYRLQQIINQDDLIYIEPDLNGAKPDFVILRPNIGILIIEVFENELSKIRKSSDGTLKEKDYSNNLSNSDSYLLTPISTLNSYQDTFIGSIAELTDAVIDNSRNLGLVKKLLICSKCETIDACRYFDKDTYYTTIYGSDFVTNANLYQHLFRDIRFTYHNGIFDDSVLQQMIKLLSPTWHSYREGRNITLTTPQRNLAESQANSLQKISGVAGAGKTQVMCTRAINAVKRTGGRVLILTFNIALINYLRIRLSEIREDFSWSNIELDYYHRFFRKIAGTCNLEVKFSSYDNVNFFDVCSTSIQRYDTILIDEVQDYKNEWIQIINQKFLKGNGEFVVFGDPSQNIYHRDVDTQGDIRIGTIPGLWNKSLSRSERFSNPSLTELAVKFKVQFKIGSITEQEHDIRLNSQLSFNLIKYFSRVPQESLKDTAQSILDITYQVLDTLQQRNSPEIRNVAIICANTDILKEIDYLYRGVNNTSTTLTFLNKEQEAKISRNSHVASWEYKRDYDRKERQIKDTFTTDTPFLKLATIQSFKGWEAKTVILIIMPERNVMHKSDTMSEQDNKDTQFNVPELIYTGITRSRENLIVINVGNDTYHEFFKSNIQ
jgi:hypothetical protein